MPLQLPPVILPLASLPDIEYFYWLFYSREARIEIHETFPRQTCRNRYRIATAGGTLTLSIPVVKPDGNHTQTSAIQIDQSKSWKQIHWRSIESAYNKSPFFLYYRDDFEAVLEIAPLSLMDFNLKIINLCCKLLKQSPDFKLSETFIKEPVGQFDMRHRIMPKQPITHQYSIMEFEPYTQVFSDRQEFIPNLSMLDLLFNLGPDAGSYLRRLKEEISDF